MSRALAAAAAAVLLLLAGCSSTDDGGGSDESEAERVSAAGVSFEVPDGWKELDPDDVAAGADGNASIDELADRMGLTRDQFLQTMRSVDLFLFSDEGSDQGFVDNVNVLQVEGEMPDDDQIQLQFQQLGAQVGELSHEETELGDTTILTYTLDIGEAQIEGEAIYVDVGDGPVSVTVSATDRATADEVADQILESLAEAS